MSYQRPQSAIKLFNVPWSKDDGNLLKFSSREVQSDQMNKYVDTVKHFIAYQYNIVKDGVIRVEGNAYKFMDYNYMMFQNPDTGNSRWYYAFVDDVKWLSYNSAEIYYTLDAWQCYQFDISFKKCFVERSHVPVSEDTVGRWLAPEPIGVEAKVVKNISDFDTLDWSPSWVLHSTSWYDMTKKEYNYEGLSSGDIITSEVGLNVPDTDTLKNIVKFYGKKSINDIFSDVGSETGYKSWRDWLNALGGWDCEKEEPVKYYSISNALIATTSVADIQDHRDELIGLYAVPLWVKGGVTKAKFVSVSNHTELINVAINQSKLPCGYTPRNKKMLTSMCRGFCIYTKNGFKKTFKPELMSSTAQFRLSGNAMATDGVFCEMYNYQDASDKSMKIPFNCQTRFGYDGNTGLDKGVNALQSSIGLIGSVASITTGNALGILYGANNVVSSATNMIDAIGQRGISNGTTGDLLTITNGNATPHFADVSVTKEEAEYIDDYLDIYGYTINEIQSVNINSRPSWNYIKVAKLNAQIKAPDVYAQSIISQFQNGCHIWHTSIENVGNFGLSNR